MWTLLAQRPPLADMPHPMPTPCRRPLPEPAGASRIAPRDGGWTPEWKIRYLAVRPDGPPHSLPDGCAVQEEGSEAVHVMCGGSAFRVHQWQDLQRLGLTDLGVVRQLPPGGLGALRRWPQDGSIFRLLGSDEVCLVVGGARVPVASPTELSRVNVESRRLVVLPADAADGMPGVPADGTPVRVPDEHGGWALFTVRGGRLQPVPDPDPCALRAAQAAPRAIFRVLAPAALHQER